MSMMQRSNLSLRVSCSTSFAQSGSFARHSFELRGQCDDAFSNNRVVIYYQYSVCFFVWFHSFMLSSRVKTLFSVDEHTLAVALMALIRSFTVCNPMPSLLFVAVLLLVCILTVVCNLQGIFIFIVGTETDDYMTAEACFTMFMVSSCTMRYSS